MEVVKIPLSTLNQFRYCPKCGDKPVVVEINDFTVRVYCLMCDFEIDTTWSKKPVADPYVRFRCYTRQNGRFNSKLLLSSAISQTLPKGAKVKIGINPETVILKFGVEGNIVHFIPTKHIVMVESTRAIKALQKHGYPIPSTLPFKYENGVWIGHRKDLIDESI